MRTFDLEKNIFYAAGAFACASKMKQDGLVHHDMQALPGGASSLMEPEKDFDQDGLLPRLADGNENELPAAARVDLEGGEVGSMLW